MKQSAGEVFAPILLVLGIVVGIGVWHEWTGGAEGVDIDADIARPGGDTELGRETVGAWAGMGGGDAYPSWTGDSAAAPWRDDASPTLAQRGYETFWSFFSSDPDLVDGEARVEVAMAESDDIVFDSEVGGDDDGFGTAMPDEDLFDGALDVLEREVGALDAAPLRLDRPALADRWETSDAWSPDTIWMGGAPDGRALADLGPRRASTGDWR